MCIRDRSTWALHHFEMISTENRLTVKFDGFQDVLRKIYTGFISSFQFNAQDEQYFKIAKHLLELRLTSAVVDEEECKTIAMYLIFGKMYDPKLESRDLLNQITLREFLDNLASFKADNFKSLSVGFLDTQNTTKYVQGILPLFRALVRKVPEEKNYDLDFYRKSIAYRMKAGCKGVKKSKTYNLYDFGAFDHKKNFIVSWLYKYLNSQATIFDFRDFFSLSINKTRFGSSASLGLVIEAHSYEINPHKIDQKIEAFLKHAIDKLISVDLEDKFLQEIKSNNIESIKGLTFSLDLEADFYLDYLKEGHEEIYRPDHIRAIVEETSVFELKRTAQTYLIDEGSKLSVQIYPTDIDIEIPSESLSQDQTLNKRRATINILS
eukprot:TRINITY_DN13156_c0_g1_i2.p1 TRINITY_DN13156_c0_g1~~TRINITY_DN13156_c0_g1_i2.p1  ORF type:complete len:398 (-),score=65.14 TRINITY_DN13156_c0_g1_i2:111-1247(-)